MSLLPNGRAVSAYFMLCRLRGCPPGHGDGPCLRCDTFQRIKDKFEAMTATLKWHYRKEVLDALARVESPIWAAMQKYSNHPLPGEPEDDSPHPHGAKAARK